MGAPLDFEQAQVHTANHMGIGVPPCMRWAKSVAAFGQCEQQATQVPRLIHIPEGSQTRVVLPKEQSDEGAGGPGHHQHSGVR